MNISAEAEVAPARAVPSAAEIVLAIQAAARSAADAVEMSHVIANETRKLVRCGQVSVFRRRDNACVLLAMSSVSSIERTSPLVQDLESALNRVWPTDHEPQFFSLDDLRGGEDLRLVDMAYGSFLLVPFVNRGGTPLGAMLLARNEVWSERELKLLQHVAGAYAHAWGALEHPPRVWIRQSWRKYLVPAGVVAGLLLAIVPVPLTALAPCEIVPLDPETVTAPLDGIIQSV